MSESYDLIVMQDLEAMYQPFVPRSGKGGSH